MALVCMEPVHNPGLAPGVVDLGTGTELIAMLLGLFGGGVWLLKRALAGRGRLVTAALKVGGAAANLTGRLLTGEVRDFTPTPWAVLNPADLFLAVGVGLLYSELWQMSRRTGGSQVDIGKLGFARHGQEGGPYAPGSWADLSQWTRSSGWPG